VSRPLAVFDVDGVLADVGHRVHHLEAGRQDWRSFFAAAKDDPPLETGLALAHELATEHDLAYLTGRPEGLRRVTRRWLGRHVLPAGPLVMRPPGDFRPARVMKLAALRRLAADHDVEIVIDDDDDVVRALQQAGYAVLHASWAAHTRRQGRTLHRAQEEDGRT
jgi:phosphoglycolate phosphatase-like HAD superfamily hydrolase